jgi:hypothetical protein
MFWIQMIRIVISPLKNKWMDLILETDRLLYEKWNFQMPKLYSEMTKLNASIPLEQNLYKILVKYT